MRECRPNPGLNPYIKRKSDKLAKMIETLNEAVLAWGLAEALEENDISQKRIRKEVFPEFPIEPESCTENGWPVSRTETVR